jgi:hypothetical protein
MMDNYLIRTNYYSRPWTWLKTIILVIVFILVLVVWDMVDQETSYFWIKYIVFIVFTFGVVSAPVDDIALDSINLYHLKTSLLPFMSKVNVYNIKKIKSIRGGGSYTKSMDFLEYFTMSNFSGRTNSIEIVFTDDTYKSIYVGIYRDELQSIISKVRDIKENSAQQNVSAIVR